MVQAQWMSSFPSVLCFFGNRKRLSYELHSVRFSSRWIKCFSTLYFLQCVCPRILQWFRKADKCSQHFFFILKTIFHIYYRLFLLTTLVIFLITKSFYSNHVLLYDGWYVFCCIALEPQ